MCSRIDRICRQFIWGSSEYKKRVHLVSWDKVCKPKEQGGLGFRKEREINIVWMTKLAWGIVNKPEALWVRVMRNKYRCGEETIPNIRRRSKASNAWKGIASVWPYFKQNLIWRVRDGNSVRIWKDHWILGIDRLGDFVHTQLNENQSEQCINEYGRSDGSWDWEKLS